MGDTLGSRPRPHIQIACVCEKVLMETDSVLSVIRVVDTYTLETSELPTGYKGAAELTAVVSLKSGDVVGEHEVGLRLVPPDGADRPVQRWPVEFRGGEHGVNLTIKFTLLEPKIGLYWFDVLWADEVLTRIPFRMKLKNQTESTASEAAPRETTTH